MQNRVLPNRAHQLRTTTLRFCLLAFLLVSLIQKNLVAQGKNYITPAGAIIKYLGFVEDKLLFHVDIDNRNAERCFISIKDEQGDVLYTQEFKDSKFTKTFGINKDELAGNNLVFVLNKGKVKQEQVFEVSINSRVIQDVVVAKQ